LSVTIDRAEPARITRASIEAAWRRRAPNTRTIIPDQACRGLCLVVHAHSMSWVYAYKPRGLDPITGRRFPTKSVTIGSPDTHSPDEARQAAGILKGQTKVGRDPAAERRIEQEKGSERRGQTIARLLDLYATVLPRRPKLRGRGTLSPKAVADELAQLRAAMSRMNALDKPVAEIGTQHLRSLLHAEAERPATARARYGALNRFFDWCLDEGFVPLNPCVTVSKAKRPKPPKDRAVYLHLDQLAALWRAAGTTARLRDVHCDLVRFLIAIPCRRGEAAALDWKHLDLAQGVWTQANTATKNGEPHRFFLPPLVLNLLRTQHAAAGYPAKGLVFPSPQAGRQVDTFTDIKAALVDATGIDGWRWHDFRRSFATALAEAGVAESVADAILNHKQSATRGGVLGVYQRAQRWPEQVAAMTTWADLLSSTLTGRYVVGSISYDVGSSTIAR
jgi:integrase